MLLNIERSGESDKEQSKEWVVNTVPDPKLARITKVFHHSSTFSKTSTHDNRMQKHVGDRCLIIHYCYTFEGSAVNSDR